MAAKEDDSLIGFDPLAWMDGEPESREADTDKVGQPSEDKAETLVASEIDAKIDAASEWVENNSDESGEAMNESENRTDDTPTETHVSPSENDMEENTTTEPSSSPTGEVQTETEQGVEDVEKQAVSTNVISLESTQNIQNVSDLHQQIFAVYQQHDKIEIDASEVSSIDTSSLQLLLVLKHSAMNDNKEVSFDFPSERFIEAAELLGMSEMLGVDKADAGFF